MYSVIIYFMGAEIKHGWVKFEDTLRAFLAILLAAMGMAQVGVGGGEGRGRSDEL